MPIALDPAVHDWLPVINRLFCEFSEPSISVSRQTNPMNVDVTEGCCQR